MKIRLGYVSIALKLKDCSTSKTTTLKVLNKIGQYEKVQYKLKKILNENLSNLIRVLNYNIEYGIFVYRITSKLVPFATHPIVEDWEYINDFKDKFIEIGNIIKSNNIRVSAHPDHYTVINTNSPQVFNNSVNDLEYLNKLFNSMGLNNNYKLVTHIGGKYLDKNKSIQNFIDGFSRLSEQIKKRIVIENDDKIYNIKDVLDLCNHLNIPMVLDVHHHNCNNDNFKLKNYLGDIFNTWNNEIFVPKVHFSSPKNEKQYRSHADDINLDEFVCFLNIAKEINKDFDVMIEAKNKDLALFKLISELKNIKNIEFINSSQFEY